MISKYPLLRGMLAVFVLVLSLGGQGPVLAQTPGGPAQPGATFDLVSGGQMAGPNAEGVIVPGPLPGPDYSMPDPSQVFAFAPNPGKVSNLPSNVGQLVASGNLSNAPQSVLAAGVDDRDNTDLTGWAVYEHQSTQNVLDTASNGNLRVVDLFVEVPGASPVFTATYVSNSGSYDRPWYFLANVSTADLLNFVTTNNQRIIVQKVFYDASQPVAANRVRFFAVMIPNTGADAKSWYFYKDQTTAQLTALWQADNARITQVNSYDESGTKLYDAVMIANTGTDARSWEWWVNANTSYVSGRISATGFRLTDMDIDASTGNFNVILTSCPGGCPLWWWWVGVPTSSLLNFAAQDGARIIDANSIPGCGDRCWSFILINDSNAITSRVGEMLRSQTDGTVGLYLKQVGGPVLANLMDGTAFEPASAIKVVTNLYTMRQIQAGSVSLSTLITRYLPPASGSCPGNTPNGTENINTAVREMMWHSDNTRTRELNDYFGTANVNTMASALGMVHTAILHIIGCGGPVPDQTTLDDLALLYEGVANTTFVDAAHRDMMFSHMAGKAEFQTDGYDWTHLWDTDIPNMIKQEAPPFVHQLDLKTYQNQMDLAYKAGNYNLCANQACTSLIYDIAISGWVKIPFCDAGGPRQFAFGTFINTATNLTNASAAFNSTKAELLREQIHAGLASCFRAAAYIPLVRK